MSSLSTTTAHGAATVAADADADADAAAVFGNLNATLVDQLAQAVATSLQQQCKLLPVMDDDEKQQRTQLLQARLQQPYWQALDVLEIYSARNIFTVRHVPRHRRQQLLLLAANIGSTSMLQDAAQVDAVIASLIMDENNMDSTTITPMPAQAPLPVDVPMSVAAVEQVLQQNNDMNDLSARLLALQSSLQAWQAQERDWHDAVHALQAQHAVVKQVMQVMAQHQDNTSNSGDDNNTATAGRAVLLLGAQVLQDSVVAARNLLVRLEEEQQHNENETAEFRVMPDEIIMGGGAITTPPHATATIVSLPERFHAEKAAILQDCHGNIGNLHHLLQRVRNGKNHQNGG